MISPSKAKDLFGCVSVYGSPLAGLPEPTLGDGIETREEIVWVMLWVEEVVVDAVSLVPPTARANARGDRDQGVLAPGEFINTLKALPANVIIVPVLTDVGVEAALVGLEVDLGVARRGGHTTVRG